MLCNLALKDYCKVCDYGIHIVFLYSRNSKEEYHVLVWFLLDIDLCIFFDSRYQDIVTMSFGFVMVRYG